MFSLSIDLIYFFKINFSLVFIFGLFGLPKILIDHARPFYDNRFGLKYEKEKTISSFTNWWVQEKKRNDVPDFVNIVYGHTHYLNYLDEKQIRGENIDFYLMKLKKKEELQKRNQY